MNPFFRDYWLYPLILSGLLTACAGMPLQPFAPQISVTNFSIAEIGLLEQNFLLQLHLKNPNPFPLPITNLDYVLYLNDQEFTRGLTEQAIMLPALGEAALDLKIVSNLWRIVEQWRNWQSSFSRQFNYRLTGGVNVVNGAAKIPYEYKGSVTLTWNKK
jgi:LEA14-like dessication related protein